MKSSTSQISIITTILLSIVSFVLTLIVLIPSNDFSNINENLSETIKNDSFKEKFQNSLLPSGYVKPSSSSAIQSTTDLTLPTEKDNSNNILPSKKQASITVTPTNLVKPTLITEKISSTLEGRDLDRAILGQLIADRISEYNFDYQKLPDIYSNKSGDLLTISPSTRIYFYNDKENRTNAIGILLPSDSYLFAQVNTCENAQNKVQNMAFKYDKINYKIFTCNEKGTETEFIIMN